MYTTKKMIPAAIGVAGLAFASMVAAGNAPASATATCQLSVDSIKVLNLQDGNGNDEVFAKLGTQRTPVLQYVLNQKRNNIGTEVFQGSIDLKVFEKDPNNLTRVGTINNIPCSNNPGQITDLSGAGAVYRVVWSVA
jgi:hypothetical protein